MSQGLGRVRITNDTPYRHRSLVCAGPSPGFGLVFPPGAVRTDSVGQMCVEASSGLPIGVENSIASWVAPTGERWPDGTVRYGIGHAVVEIPANADEWRNVVPIANEQIMVLSDWAKSLLPWIVHCRLVVELMDGTRILSPVEPATATSILAPNPSALGVVFAQRVPGTCLTWHMGVWYGSGTDVAHVDVLVVNSDPTKPDTKQAFKSIRWESPLASQFPTGVLRGMVPFPMEGVMGPSVSWELSGVDWLGDGQGIPPVSGVIPLDNHIAQPIPDTMDRLAVVQAEWTWPLQGMHDGHGKPGLFGPHGDCGQVENVAASDAQLTNDGRGFQGRKTALPRWAEWKFEEFANTGAGGEHPCHGVNRLADLCLTTNPRGLMERVLGSIGEFRRTPTFFEADGRTLVRTERHPDWLAWAGQTHRSSVDKLGKPVPATGDECHGWTWDTEHGAMQDWAYLCPLIAITGNYWLRLIGRARLEHMKAHGPIQLFSYAARAQGQCSAAITAYIPLIGEPSDRVAANALMDWLVTYHEQGITVWGRFNGGWGKGPGPVRPTILMGGSSNDRRYFEIIVTPPEPQLPNQQAFWITWQHAFAVWTLLYASRVLNHAGLRRLVERISYTHDNFGFAHTPDLSPFGGVAWKQGGQPLTLAEELQFAVDWFNQLDGQWHKTPGYTTKDTNTDWKRWGRAALRVGKMLAQAKGDAAWLARATELDAAREAEESANPQLKAKSWIWTGSVPVDPVPVT